MFYGKILKDMYFKNRHFVLYKNVFCLLFILPIMQKKKCSSRVGKIAFHRRVYIILLSDIGAMRDVLREIKNKIDGSKTPVRPVVYVNVFYIPVRPSIPQKEYHGVRIYILLHYDNTNIMYFIYSKT